MPILDVGKADEAGFHDAWSASLHNRAKSNFAIALDAICFDR
jgi:hypothetical protein